MENVNVSWISVSYSKWYFHESNKENYDQYHFKDILKHARSNFAPILGTVIYSMTLVMCEKTTTVWIIVILQSVHYHDVIMGPIPSQITSLTIVYAIVYSDADQRKHQSSASLAFVWGIHRDRWIPRTKGQLRGKYFHLMTSSCYLIYLNNKLFCFVLFPVIPVVKGRETWSCSCVLLWFCGSRQRCQIPLCDVGLRLLSQLLTHWPIGDLSEILDKKWSI